MNSNDTNPPSSMSDNGTGPKARPNMLQRIQSINNTQLPVLLRYIRFTNVILSVFQCIAGVMGMTSFIVLDITGALISIYVVLFALILLLFECRLSSMETRIRTNFGFLYSYQGRASFILFFAFLDFGMETTLGYVAGVLMILNACFNFFVMCRHPEFRSGHISTKDDPTKGYTTGSQEAMAYIQTNPALVKQAASFASSETHRSEPSGSGNL